MGKHTRLVSLRATAVMALYGRHLGDSKYATVSAFISTLVVLHYARLFHFKMDESQRTVRRRFEL